MINPLCTLRASNIFYSIAKKHQETTKLWGTLKLVSLISFEEEGKKRRKVVKKKKIQENWGKEKRRTEVKTSDRMESGREWTLGAQARNPPGDVSVWPPITCHLLCAARPAARILQQEIYSAHHGRTLLFPGINALKGQ